MAVIGKPNAGKSSLINRFTGEKRLIVSDVPGTTRDAVDTLVDRPEGRFVFVDTAGIRRQSKVKDSVERYSVLRARAAVERADVCLIVIDDPPFSSSLLSVPLDPARYTAPTFVTTASLSSVVVRPPTVAP